MNISRKQFFKKSLFSLGEAVSTVTGIIYSSNEQDIGGKPDIADFEPVPNDARQAAAYNDHCLARNSGCFACVERCDVGAIRLIPGVGIRINTMLCTGCGTCEYVCPVEPKAVRMVSRTESSQLDENRAANPPEKGDTTC